MTKIPDNFAKKLKKLDNYFILREECGYFIMGTTSIIKEHIEIHSTFSTYTANKDRKVWSFFILIMDEDCLELDEFKQFKRNKFPILVLPKNIANSKIDKIKEYMDYFVNMKA